MAAPISNAATHRAAMSLARLKAADESISGMSDIPFGCGAGRSGTPLFAQLETPVSAGEYHRHEQQGGHGGEYQSADHGASQRGVLLGPLAQTERHGHHADDHRQRRHEHRPYA